jgi:hypothetical protein
MTSTTFLPKSATFRQAIRSSARSSWLNAFSDVTVAQVDLTVAKRNAHAARNDVIDCANSICTRGCSRGGMVNPIGAFDFAIESRASIEAAAIPKGTPTRPIARAECNGSCSAPRQRSVQFRQRLNHANALKRRQLRAPRVRCKNRERKWKIRTLWEGNPMLLEELVEVSATAIRYSTRPNTT